VVQANAELVVATSTAVAVPREPEPSTGYSDDDSGIGAGDVTIPRLNIVQKVGDLSTIYAGGTILLAKSVILHEIALKDATGKVTKPGLPPIQVVITGFGPTTYTEKVQGGGLGKIFRDVAEVVAAGGTTNYNEWTASGKKRVYAEQTEEALILIKRPDHLSADNANFPFVLGDKSAWAVARWSMKGTAFTHAAKNFMSARKWGVLSTRNGRTYADGIWNVETALKSMNGNWYYQPVVGLQAEFASVELKELALAVRG
jgi:hypothetical protein